MPYIVLFFLFSNFLFLGADTCDGDCKDGRGVKIFSNGDRYEGDFKKSLFEGAGIFQSSKGYQYKGQFKEGKKNGLGIWASFIPDSKTVNSEVTETNTALAISKSIYYEGEWKNNRREGKGKLIIKKSGKEKIYSGQFVNGKLNGRGTLNTDFAKYSGVFKDNRLNGQGVFENKKGDRYVGGFLNFKFDGKGAYTFRDKSLFIGDFKAGKFHGKGRLFNSKHKVIQSGRWQAGEFKK